MDWIINYLKQSNINENNGYRGSGFFTFDLLYYRNYINLSDLRNNKNVCKNNIIYNNYTNWSYGAEFIGNRTSIDNNEYMVKFIVYNLINKE